MKGAVGIYFEKGGIKYILKLLVGNFGRKNVQSKNAEIIQRNQS